MERAIARACGDPRVAGIVSEFEGSLRREPGRWRFTRFLHERPVPLSVSLALLALPPIVAAVRTAWELSDRLHDPAALFVTASAALVPALAVYSALMAYYTLRARYLARAPVVTRPHHPAYLPLLYWLLLPVADPLGRAEGAVGGSRSCTRRWYCCPPSRFS